MEYKTFKYKNYRNCYFEVGNYLYNSQAMYIELYGDGDGEKDGLIITVTVNINDFYMPDTATIKNYSDNAGITKFLQKLGIIEEIYSRRKCNPYALDSETIDFCLINIEKLKTYSKSFNYEWKTK